MYRQTHFHRHCLLVAFLLCIFSSFAQPNTTIELQKPAKYQNRALPSEKTGNKKFTIPKRLYTNMVSQYNYFFNANTKLEAIISKAKESFKEDYTQLLPFYNYSLDETAKGQIDTVIYKCTAGLLLHDLRSDWVDQFYLLLGKAYMHRKNFDSAAVVFQYINYAFAPKDDGYDIPIGSNASNTKGIFTISTDEKRNIWKKISADIPTRNESFLWQVRNYIEQKKLTEAAALLEIIRSDQLFPARLKSKWYELEAYLKYNLQANDSAAHFLTLALNNAESTAEKARWEFLAAQLFELAHNDSASIKMYEKAIQHSTDPLMEVYARLQIVSLSSESKPNAIQENLNQLLAMAKKDKYQGYRDIIYYSAAALELKRVEFKNAEKYLLKSIATSENNEALKQQSLFQLADIAYTTKKYVNAARFYDSIQVAYLPIPKQVIIQNKKTPLDSIATNLIAIQLEDSLQQIASMPIEARNLYLKNILKKLRKEKGLKETDTDLSFGSVMPIAAPEDLFKPAGNDFYFSSGSLKTKGLSEFKAKWGNRPNIDNWRRQSIVDRSFSNTSPDVSDVVTLKSNAKPTDKEISIFALTNELPLSTAAIQQSNDKIIEAYMQIGYTFQYYLNDYPKAIEAYESILKRYPDSTASEKLLYQLNSCFNKTGEFAKADSLVKQLSAKFPSGKLTRNLTAVSANVKTNPAEQAYENIYRDFLEGRFETAKRKKIEADQQFGKQFWTPQLLYIESVYYVKLQQDSIAINRLENIAALFPKTEIASKAATMIDVLKRRKEIESYLTNLTIEKIEEPIVRNVELNNTDVTKIDLPKKDTSSSSIPKKITSPAVLATMATPTPIAVQNKFEFIASDTQFVVLVLTMVDPIFISEARNAFNRFNQGRFNQQKLTVSATKITDSTHYLLIGPFKNAADASSYIDQTKPITSNRIVPWLPADKYNYSFISPANLALLRSNKNPSAYQAFLHTIFPDKF